MWKLFAVGCGVKSKVYLSRTVTIRDLAYFMCVFHRGCAFCLEKSTKLFGIKNGAWYLLSMSSKVPYRQDKHSLVLSPSSQTFECTSF